MYCDITNINKYVIHLTSILSGGMYNEIKKAEVTRETKYSEIKGHGLMS